MEVMRNSDDEVTITCISNGIPPPTVIWLKNNTSITTSAGVVYQDMTEINATTSRSDLILKRVSIVYTCAIFSLSTVFYLEKRRK